MRGLDKMTLDMEYDTLEEKRVDDVTSIMQQHQYLFQLPEDLAYNGEGWWLVRLQEDLHALRASGFSSGIMLRSWRCEWMASWRTTCDRLRGQRATGLP